MLADNYKIAKSPNCGLEYTTPKPTDAELTSFYSDYADVRANPEITDLNATRNLDLLRIYGLNDQSIILDFGCGNGEFVEIAGERCFGVELSMGKKKERIFNHISELPIQKYDFITLWGVLEHLNDPVRVLMELKGKLRVGGTIVLTTVDAEGLIPYYYNPPEHLTYWTANAMHYLFENNNFEIKKIQPYEMCQLSEIYLDRLLSRTPAEYLSFIKSSYTKLPRIITIPTNEFLVVAELKSDHLSAT